MRLRNTIAASLALSVFTTLSAHAEVQPIMLHGDPIPTGESGWWWSTTHVGNSPVADDGRIVFWDQHRFNRFWPTQFSDEQRGLYFWEDGQFTKIFRSQDDAVDNNGNTIGFFQHGSRRTVTGTYHPETQSVYFQLDLETPDGFPLGSFPLDEHNDWVLYRWDVNTGEFELLLREFTNAAPEGRFYEFWHRNITASGEILIDAILLGTEDDDGEAQGAYRRDPDGTLTNLLFDEAFFDPRVMRLADDGRLYYTARGLGGDGFIAVLDNDTTTPILEPKPLDPTSPYDGVILLDASSNGALVGRGSVLVPMSHWEYALLVGDATGMVEINRTGDALPGTSFFTGSYENVLMDRSEAAIFNVLWADENRQELVGDPNNPDLAYGGGLYLYNGTTVERIIDTTEVLPNGMKVGGVNNDGEINVSSNGDGLYQLTVRTDGMNQYDLAADLLTDRIESIMPGPLFGTQMQLPNVDGLREIRDIFVGTPNKYGQATLLYQYWIDPGDPEHFPRGPADGGYGWHLLYTPDLYFRGTAGDGLWDSHSNWTLSLEPSDRHDVIVAGGWAQVSGPAEDTTVESLAIGGDQKTPTELWRPTKQAELDGNELYGQVAGQPPVASTGAPKLTLQAGTTLTTLDELILHHDATLNFELSSSTTAALLAVEGDVTLAGDARVTGLAEAGLNAGDTFTLITYSGTLSGAFDSVSDEGLDSELGLTLSYQPGAIVATLATIPEVAGDATGDGILNALDSLLLITALGGPENGNPGSPAAQFEACDLDDDGDVDMADAAELMVAIGI